MLATFSVVSVPTAALGKGCISWISAFQTRLQLDSSNKYRGLLHCTRTIAAEEGTAALYKGLSPFVAHLTTKYAMRFGVFGYLRNAMGGNSGSERQQMVRNFTVSQPSFRKQLVNSNKMCGMH
jgi:hypothetical protein